MHARRHTGDDFRPIIPAPHFSSSYLSTDRRPRPVPLSSVVDVSLLLFHIILAAAAAR